MLLRKRNFTSYEASELTEIFENMASVNIIAQFGAKLDALNATMKAQLDAMNSKLDTQMNAVNAKLAAQSAKYNVLIWVIGFATVILSVVMILT